MKFTEMKAIKKKFNLLNLFGWMEWKWIELFAAPSLKEKKTFLLDSNVLERVEVISNKYQIIFLTRFWELLQKYVTEIQSSFDEKQCFEMTRGTNG